MPITPEHYDEMSKKASPPSRSYKNIPAAFLVGGLICTLGEGLLKLYAALGLEKDPAGAATSVTLIFLSILLTGLDLYPKIAKVAGAGSLVPITGFANAMSSPAIEFKSEGLVLGLAAKMFVIAGPVIVYGISAGILYGLIIYALALY